MDKLLPFEMWLKSIKEEQESVLATVLPNDQFEHNHGRLFVSKGYLSIGDLGDERINQQVTNIAKMKLDEANPNSETCGFTLSSGEEVHVFIDVFIPPAEVMIFGAGHDAVPVAKYAASLGFKTTVVDQREYYNSEERFPNTERLIVKTNDFSEKIKIGYRTYIIVMNHHIERDIETLKFVLPSISPYIGVLGPRSRTIRMLDALKAEGTLFNDYELKRMHSPIGLDIGAATSEEIAISILAEVVAKKNGHSGGFLRGAEYIHHPTKTRLVV